jgi:phage terminase small subunit
MANKAIMSLTEIYSELGNSPSKARRGELIAMLEENYPDAMILTD